MSSADPACLKKQFNFALLRTLVIASGTTASAYVAWQFVTHKTKQDWSQGKSYFVLFAVVFSALIISNLILTLIIQRSTFLVCDPTTPVPTDPVNRPIFI